MALFEDNIVGDRLSDMVATIIEPNIQKYTLRIMKELEVTPDHYTSIEFTGEGFIQNPYKPCPIY